MKKYLSILIIFVLAIVCMPQGIQAEAQAAVIYYGKDVYSTTSGEGYYDVAGYPFDDERVHYGNTAILHTGDWRAYDASDITTGAYILSMNIATTKDVQTTFEVSLDGSTQLTKTVDSTGGYSSYQEVTLGRVFFESFDILKLKVTGAGSVYLESFTLTKENTGFSTIGDFEIPVQEVKSGGQGVGFYDNGNGPDHSDALEYSQTLGVCLRQNEWVKYDVSGKQPGKYLVTATVSNTSTAKLSVSTDTSAEPIQTEIEGSGSYHTYYDVPLGEITITDSTTEVKIKNPISVSLYLKELDFTFVYLHEDLKITKDAQGLEQTNSFNGLSTVYLTGNVENVFVVSNGIKIVSAFYDDSDKLLSLDIDVLDIKIGEKKAVSIPIDVNSSAAKMKIFVWSSLDRLYPIMNSKLLYEGVATHIYVNAQSGSDTNSGTTEDSALKTIDAAKLKVRAANENMKGDIIVHLSGDFKITETITLTQEDSGTNGFNVVYDGNDAAAVSGGDKITGFTQVSGTPLYKVNIGTNCDFRQLYVNGNRAQRARSKWLYFPKADYADENTAENLKENLDGFILDKADFPEDFAKVDGMEFVWMPSWKNIRMPVKALTRNSDGDYIATFEQPYFDACLAGSAASTGSPEPALNIPFYIENAPEYLDEAGEWYYNKESGELFYYPLATDNMSTAEVYIPKTEKLLSISGTEAERVSNVVIRGIEFKYGAWNRTTEKGFSTVQAEHMAYPENKTEEDTGYPYDLMHSQISVDYGKNIQIEGNKFNHLGSVALSIDNKTENSLVNGNVFDDISATAVMLSNPDFDMDTPVRDFVRNVDVTNNLIRRVAVEYMTPAITAYYVNNVNISHNDLLDSPYTGISLGWGWGKGVKNCTNNKIANNKIENVLYKLRDGGHIYTLDIMTDTVIENNYLIKSGENKGGIYLDNATNGLTVRNNVFEECEAWLKLTYNNIVNNTAYNNYSETDMNVVDEYLAANNIQQAVGKTNGVWGTEAQSIIANAGLSDEYKHLLTEYNQNTNYRNAELERMPYIAKPGIIVPAGELVDGGEGVAYHDTTDRVGIEYLYDGTGHKRIMETSQGEWTKHKVDIPQDGIYEIIINAGARSSSSRVNVWVDDVSVASYKSIQNTGETYSAPFADNTIAKLNLTKGEHIIKVEHADANFAFYSLRFVDVINNADFSRNDGFNDAFLNVVLNK